MCFWSLPPFLLIGFSQENYFVFGNRRQYLYMGLGRFPWNIFRRRTFFWRTTGLLPSPVCYYFLLAFGFNTLLLWMKLLLDFLLLIGSWNWCWLHKTYNGYVWAECESTTNIMWIQSHWCHSWIHISFGTCSLSLKKCSNFWVLRSDLDICLFGVLSSFVHSVYIWFASVTRAATTQLYNTRLPISTYKFPIVISKYKFIVMYV